MLICCHHPPPISMNCLLRVTFVSQHKVFRILFHSLSLPMHFYAIQAIFNIPTAGRDDIPHPISRPVPMHDNRYDLPISHYTAGKYDNVRT